jgi:tetratricopeptide (TPR) repeat protein
MPSLIRTIFFFSLLSPAMNASTNIAETEHTKAQSFTHVEDFESAISCYLTLIQNNPHDTDALFNLANIYLKIGRIDDALITQQRVVSLLQNPISALYNTGYTLKTAGRIDEAIVIYKQVLALSPSYDPAHLALGFAYLNKGDFVHGWEEHTHYLKKSNKNAERLRTLLQNNTLSDKRVLCVYEGGLGDTLMCIRYVEKLKALGAYTICAVQKSLIPLLSRCPYIDEIYPYGESHVSHDASSTLLSLPAIFNATEETIPRTIPYIFPDPDLIEYWQSQLAGIDGIKIGLCWQADVYNDSSRLPIARRGMPLHHWFPLLNIPGIHVYSLQRFDGTEQIGEIPSTCSLHVFDTLDTTHGDFMDTAALITQLDLVISVDTAVAHLAGALGKQVLLLLPYAVDWRWIYGRTDSPWYPTMRIFKQPAAFDWNTVVEQVYAYLKH